MQSENIQRKLFLIGGTGGGPTAYPFRSELWRHIVEGVGQPHIGFLITPSTLTEGRINILQLQQQHQSLLNSLGVTCEFIDEKRFGAGEYGDSFAMLCITCGNTAGARAYWEKHNCEEMLLSLYRKGIPIIGYSAGCIIFYERASTDSVPGPSGATYGSMECMGVLQGAIIPHADTQGQRVPDYQKVLHQDPITPALALGEEVMAVYRDESLSYLISPLEDGFAAEVDVEGVTLLPVRDL